MTQHKWYKEIQAWSEGSEIEACSAGIWFSTDYPNWHSNYYQFRIKPQTVKFSSSGHHFRLKEKKYLYVIVFNGMSEKVRFATKAELGFGEYVMGKIEVQND